MKGRGIGEEGAEAAGGPALHRPVLLAEVGAALAPERGGAFLDGTFGAGGYSTALLAAAADVAVIGVDRDPDAIRGARAEAARWDGRLLVAQGRFGELDRIAADLGHPALDGVVLDIGVSSMQLDRGERGFSFRHDGPLDMRMEQAGPSAADLVNGASEAELADILFHYGEERRSRAVARAVVERRRRRPIETTGELAELVAQHVRGEPGFHPATRTFQALRIAVNDELTELVDALHAAERALKPGGRLVVVTFQSLEDRLVKQFLQSRTSRLPRSSRHLPSEEPAVPSFSALTKGPVAPGPDEIRANPRSRSAKLRAGERTEAPAGGRLDALYAAAGLPQRSARGGSR